MHFLLNDIYYMQLYCTNYVQLLWKIYMSGFMKTRLKDGYHALSGRFFLARNYRQKGQYKN